MTFRGLFAVNGLSLDRLHALVAVDAAGNIAAAAPLDRNRQSQISRQIGDLERFFETTLKRTEGRTARLTEEGRQLAALAREHLRSLDEFRRGVKGRPLPVSLAAGAALHEWVVLPRVADLRAGSAHVTWQIQTRRNAMMLQQLLDGSLDFALLRSDLARRYAGARGPTKGRGAADRPAVVGVPLGTMHYSVFVPDKICPRAPRLPLPEILHAVPIATQGDDTKFQLALESALAECGWPLNAVFFAESFTQVASMIATETMAGILPDIAVAAFNPNRVWRRPLHELRGLGREISLAWNPARHERLPALRKIRPLLERTLRFQAGAALAGGAVHGTS